jgi:hypothetical protein
MMAANGRARAAVRIFSTAAAGSSKRRTREPSERK